MRAQSPRALGEKQAGLAFLVGQQDHRDAGGTAAVGRDRAAHEAGQMRTRPLAERVVERCHAAERAPTASARTLLGGKILLTTRSTSGPFISDCFLTAGHSGSLMKAFQT